MRTKLYFAIKYFFATQKNALNKNLLLQQQHQHKTIGLRIKSRKFLRHCFLSTSWCFYSKATEIIHPYEELQQNPSHIHFHPLRALLISTEAPTIRKDDFEKYNVLTIHLKRTLTVLSQQVHLYASGSFKIYMQRTFKIFSTRQCMSIHHVTICLSYSAFHRLQQFIWQHHEA